MSERVRRRPFDAGEPDPAARPSAALPVPEAPGPAAVDLSRPAQSAEEYLRQVRAEAAALPDVFRAAAAATPPCRVRPPGEPERGEEKAEEGGEEAVPAVPCVAARRAMCHAFSDFRLTLARYTALGAASGRGPSRPGASDATGWRQRFSSEGPGPLLLIHLSAREVTALLEHLATGVETRTGGSTLWLGVKGGDLAAGTQSFCAQRGPVVPAYALSACACVSGP